MLLYLGAMFFFFPDMYSKVVGCQILIMNLFAYNICISLLSACDMCNDDKVESNVTLWTFSFCVKCIKTASTAPF